MADMLQQVQDKGIMAKCRERECGALNPNPKKNVCWCCGQNALSCPRCQQSPILRYNIEGDFWKCPSAGCGKKFAIRAEKKATGPILSKEKCPKCSRNLYYDPQLLLWKCNECKRTYTKADLQGDKTQEKAKQHSEESTARSEYKERPANARVKSDYSRRSSISWAAFPISLAVIAGIGNIIYTLSNFDLWGQITSIVILALALFVIIWNAVMLGWLWKYRPRKASLARVSSPIILAALLVLGVIAWSQWGDEIRNLLSVSPENPTPENSIPTPKQTIINGTDVTVNGASTSDDGHTDDEPIVQVHTEEELEQQIFDAINQRRTERLQPPLVWDEKLYEEARKHSSYMASIEKCTRDGKGTYYQNVYWCTINQNNIAGRAVDAWETSIDPSNSFNLLTPLAKYGAVAVSSSETAFYVTYFAIREKPVVPRVQVVELVEDSGYTPQEEHRTDFIQRIIWVAGADGLPIVLSNNPDASNPTFQELKDFLYKDPTDKRDYKLGRFVCGDFAEMLHNNAEEAGIRAAFVGIMLGPCSYYPSGGGHALNAFETTDRGLIYIDCTGTLGNTDINADRIVIVQEGKAYIPRSLFPQPGWSVEWESMGVVEEIDLIEW